MKKLRPKKKDVEKRPFFLPYSFLQQGAFQSFWKLSEPVRKGLNVSMEIFAFLGACQGTKASECERSGVVRERERTEKPPKGTLPYLAKEKWIRELLPWANKQMVLLNSKDNCALIIVICFFGAVKQLESSNQSYFRIQRGKSKPCLQINSVSHWVWDKKWLD